MLACSNADYADHYSNDTVHKNRRTKSAVQSLARMPPSSTEAEALHSLYLQSTVESETTNPRTAGDERVPMGETRLEKTLTMYPQERKCVPLSTVLINSDMTKTSRSIHQKIFGGYLMRLAYEVYASLIHERRRLD